MSAIYDFLLKLVNLFPPDPLSEFVAGIEPISVLGYLNYFLPISTMLTLTDAWCGVMITAKVVMFFYNTLTKKG